MTLTDPVAGAVAASAAVSLSAWLGLASRHRYPFALVGGLYAVGSLTMLINMHMLDVAAQIVDLVGLVVGAVAVSLVLWTMRVHPDRYDESWLGSLVLVGFIAVFLSRVVAIPPDPLTIAGLLAVYVGIAYWETVIIRQLPSIDEAVAEATDGSDDQDRQGRG